MKNKDKNLVVHGANECVREQVYIPLISASSSLALLNRKGIENSTVGDVVNIRWLNFFRKSK